MPNTVETVTGHPELRPFVLKWAENMPEDQMFSHRSVFSAAVDGLDLSQVIEAERHETTGGSDTLDTTQTSS